MTPTELRIGDWMQTFTGKVFWPLDPRAEEVCLEDIAHALAFTSRFNGHCKKYYSVAEHSIKLSQLVSPEIRLEALFHDAAEAYLGDIIRPLKCFLDIFAAEAAVLRAISQRFCLAYTGDIQKEIKNWDDYLLAQESTFVMGGQTKPWNLTATPTPNADFEFWQPTVAERLFLSHYNNLARKGIQS